MSVKTKEIKMAEVKIVRLMSGEEIIANITQTETEITLKNPSVLIPSPEGKLLLAKWLLPLHRVPFA